MRIKTSPRGIDRKSKSAGFSLISMVIGLLIAAVSFTTVAGSIAMLVRSAGTTKNGLIEDIAKRNAWTIDRKIVFEKQDN